MKEQHERLKEHHIRSHGAPWLWVLEGFNFTSEPTDILSLTLNRIQCRDLPEIEGERLQGMNLEDLLTDRYPCPLVCPSNQAAKSPALSRIQQRHTQIL